MKLLPALCALAIAIALVGCGGNQAQKEHAATHETEPHGTATETAPGTEAAPAEGTPVTLTGTVGCGHCNFGKTEHCSAALQTAAGEVYVLDGVATDSELWKMREESAKQCELTGTASKGADGLMHLTVTSYKVL